MCIGVRHSPTINKPSRSNFLFFKCQVDLSFYTAHARQCYNKTILCENFTTDGNNCSSNIQRFVVHRIPGCEPQYQIQLMLRHAIPGDTDVRVVRCSSPSECNIDNVTADSFFGNSSCDCLVLQPMGTPRSPLLRVRCGSEEFRQEDTTLLRFTRTSHCSEGPENVIVILTMEGESCLYGQSIINHISLKMKP